MCAHLEGGGRTLQESFAYFHHHLLFTDLKTFNRNLGNTLTFHYTHRPHHRLHNKSPIQSLLEHHPGCQRW